MGTQMSLEAFLPWKDSTTVSALYAARRSAPLHHEIRKGVRSWPATTMAFGAAGTRSGSVSRGPRIVFPVFGRRARAARTEIHVPRLLAPIPWIEHRIAHRWATRQRFRQGTRFAFWRVQFHFHAFFASPHTVHRPP